jgi:uncharacterized protein YggU (UPF0235/DUF167 family)
VVRFWVRLTPHAAGDRVDGVADDATLQVRVQAAAADGAANAALLRILATTLAVPRTSLAIVAGATSRRKLVELDDAYRDRLIELWPGLIR